MSRFRHALASRDSHIWSLRGIILILAIACGGLWYGWQNAPRHLTIYNPPDLRSGSTRKWWVVPPASVYSFAFYIWQEVNRWPSNGLTNYQNNIVEYAPYLTPHCQRFLKTDYKARKDRNELKDRVRGMYEIPGRGYQPKDVTILDRNNWVVRLNLEINEYLDATRVRQLFIRYHLRVVRADVDPQRNPWGLQLDCFASPPVQLTVPSSDKSEIRKDSRAGGRDDTLFQSTENDS
ncbi:MAG: TIGR03746 family integrating conjugative element protein [Salinisphaera sp.]|jgi:integrating conjugative element protein (TIGR03746 family)|nr:TIGR03746 family integrating conjugative element protein [Salinisphaera sp.]